MAKSIRKQIEELSDVLPPVIPSTIGSFRSFVEVKREFNINVRLILDLLMDNLYLYSSKKTKELSNKLLGVVGNMEKAVNFLDNSLSDIRTN